MLTARQMWGIACAAAAIVAFAIAGSYCMVGCADAVPSEQATTCVARYASCATLSSALPEYVACRGAVDTDCLGAGNVTVTGGKDGASP